MKRLVVLIALLLIAGCTTEPRMAPAAVGAVPTPTPTVTVTATETAQPRPAPTVTETVFDTETQVVYSVPTSCIAAMNHAEDMQALAHQFSLAHGRYADLFAKATMASEDGDIALVIHFTELANEVNSQMEDIGMEVRPVVQTFKSSKAQCREQAKER